MSIDVTSLYWFSYKHTTNIIFFTYHLQFTTLADINFFNKYFVYIDVPKHYRRARAHSIANDGIFVSIDFVSLVGLVVDLPTSMGITLRSRKRYSGLPIGCMVGVADSIA